MLRTLAMPGIVSLLIAGGITGQAQQRAATPNDTLKSPEVLSDGRVVFRIYAPKASAVTLAGDWIERGAPPLSLTKDEKGVWSGTAGPLSADIYSYSFSVDGVRTLDPKNTWLKPGINPPDTQFEVHGAAIAFADVLDVPHGETREVWYRSNSAGQQRRMHIYTPPGYSTGSQAYPVLYLLHGGGDDDSGWTAVGRLNFMLDNLVAQGKAKPMIVVMPDGFVRNAAGELPPSADRLIPAKAGPPLEKDLLNDIIPLVEKNYRVAAGSRNRALAGLAVGGDQALWIAPLHPEWFAYVAVFSGGIVPERDPDFEKRNAAFLNNPEKSNALIKAFWIVYGSTDANPASVKNLGAVLDKYGIHHQLRESPGGHTWINWRRWLLEILPLLFQS
jgi:enterochelin esterase family protein